VLVPVACVIAVLVTAANTYSTQRGWLKVREHGLLEQCFSGKTPKRLISINYPQKIALVFVFKPAVVMRTCIPAGRDAPVNASFARASFLRRPPHAPGIHVFECGTLRQCLYH
jgi:hypothetical protein